MVSSKAPRGSRDMGCEWAYAVNQRTKLQAIPCNLPDTSLFQKRALFPKQSLLCSTWHAD